MFWTNIIAKLLKILNNGATPNQIAGGFVLGFWLGLIPGFPLHALLIWLILLLLNVNLSMALLAMAISVGFAWGFDSLFHAFGAWILEDIPALTTTWTAMYNNSFIMLTRFNNTVVMGSTAAGLILLLPMFFIVKVLVIQYREKIMTSIQKWKLVQFIKGSQIYSLYTRMGG